MRHESLGTRHIAGIETTGQRITLTVGFFGDNGPVALVDEQWESAELGFLIYARYTDSRSGAIEYRLTNIRRADPSPELFVVPSDYTVLASSGWEDDVWLTLMPPGRYSAARRKGGT